MVTLNYLKDSSSHLLFFLLFFSSRHSQRLTSNATTFDVDGEQIHQLAYFAGNFCNGLAAGWPIRPWFCRDLHSPLHSLLTFPLSQVFPSTNTRISILQRRSC